MDLTIRGTQLRVAHRPVPVARHTRVAVDGSVAWLRLAPLTLGPTFGVLLIGLSYRGSIAGTGNAYFAWFWAGMALGCVPLVVHAAGRMVPRWQRQAAVAALALFTFAPKYLRNAAGPLYYDERAHWLQVRNVVAGHQLFVPNDAVPIIQYYPGLHAVTAAITEMTGLSVWTVSEVVVTGVHVLTALAVFLLAETVMSPRGAAIAAAVYMTNAEWVYFDTQFAYESLGVALVLWTLYFAARLARARMRPERVRWAAFVVMTGSACVLTHHLSSVALCAILLLCVLASGATATFGPGGWGRAVWLAAPTAVVSAVLTAYLALVAPSTATYLGSSAGDAIHELLSLTSATSQEGSRTPFSGSQAPGYEMLAAFAAPLLVAALLGWHVLSSRALTRDAGRGLALPASLLACGYLLSVPLVLTSAGSELARRSWAFSYVGVAMVAGWVALRLLRAASLRTALPRTALPRTASLRTLGRRWVGAGLVTLLAVLCMGNLAAGENVAYRFPGPYVFGSDARSVTVGMLAAQRWWEAVRPPGSGVVADRYNSVLYQVAPGAKVATQQQGPIMDFYLTRNPASPYMAAQLQAEGYYYLIIDKNITRAVPLLGVYFAPDEPSVNGGPPKPVDPAIINRWASSPYTTRVYDSDDITIYRLDPRYVAVTWR